MSLLINHTDCQISQKNTFDDTLYYQTGKSEFEVDDIVLFDPKTEKVLGRKSSIFLRKGRLYNLGYDIHSIGSTKTITKKRKFDLSSNDMFVYTSDDTTYDGKVMVDIYLPINYLKSYNIETKTDLPDGDLHDKDIEILSKTDYILTDTVINTTVEVDGEERPFVTFKLNSEGHTLKNWFSSSLSTWLEEKKKLLEHTENGLKERFSNDVGHESFGSFRTEVVYLMERNEPPHIVYPFLEL